MVARVAKRIAADPTVDGLLVQMATVTNALYQAMRGTSTDTIPSALIAENHALLVALGVSCPEIDAVCGRLNAMGLTPKLTGAGGGGCVFAFVPPEAVVEAKAFAATDTHAYLCSISPLGLRVIASSTAV
jgi:mevalonate kinase